MSQEMLENQLDSLKDTAFSINYTDNIRQERIVFDVRFSMGNPNDFDLYEKRTGMPERFLMNSNFENMNTYMEGYSDMLHHFSADMLTLEGAIVKTANFGEPNSIDKMMSKYYKIVMAPIIADDTDNILDDITPALRKCMGCGDMVEVVDTSVDLILCNSCTY